jgi:hypothetical protein
MVHWWVLGHIFPDCGQEGRVKGSGSSFSLVILKYLCYQKTYPARFFYFMSYTNV